MDLIRQWLGLKKQNELQIQVSNSDEIASQPSKKVTNDLKLPTLKDGKWISINKSYFSYAKEPNLTVQESDSVMHPVETTPESQIIPNKFENEAKDLNNEVVQSPIKNCLSCKVIGGGAVSAAVLFVLYHGKQNQNNYKGLQKFGFISQYLLLSTTLTLVVVAVVFDLGPLQDKKKGTTTFDLVKDDIYYFKEKMSQFFSKSTK